MRAFCRLLLLGTLAKQTTSARVRSKNDDPSSTLETASSTQALLVSASAYLAKNVPADELQVMRANPTIEVLESKGISLEQLFGWLALSKNQELKAMGQSHSLAELDTTPLEVLGLSATRSDETATHASGEEELRAAFFDANGVEEYAHVAHNSIQTFNRFHQYMESRMEHHDVPLSRGSDEQYRQWRRRQATIATGFFAQFSNVTDLGKAQLLLEDSLEINSELDQFLSMLDAEDDVDWAHTHQELGLLGTAARGVSRYVGRVAQNTAELFRQTWRTFRQMMASNERRCIAMQGEAESEEAQRVGLTSGEEMLNNNGGEVNDEEVERQIQRTEQVLGALQHGEEETKAAFDSDVSALREAGDNLAASAASGAVDADAFTATEASLGRVSDRVCKTAQHGVARRFLDLLGTMRRSVGSALAIALPGYGMRGLSAMAGLQGGFEEVIDFRNREIGYFRWGIVDIGPSMVGLGVGSYSSVGWKGYKVNWTLQDAYQTAICTPHTGTLPPLPIPLSPSLGITYCTDADNSGNVWIPELHGVNGVVFSAGISASPTGWLAANPLIQAISNLPTDVQWAKYWMFTSECFDSLGSLLRAMYTPICASCKGAAEHARVSTLRAATHVLAFPLITEMVHTFIAWQYDRHVRPEGYNPPCSDMSTNNRENPKNVVAAVSRNLARAAETAHSIESKINDLEAQLLEAVASNSIITESEEWTHLMEDRRLCSRHPLLPRCLAEDDVKHDHQEFMNVRAQLNNRSVEELVESCHRFRGIRSCGWRSKESLVDALAERVSTFASQDEPFGTCHQDGDCVLPNQKCGHVHGVLQCKCLRNFCHRLDAEGQAICGAQHEGSDAIRDVAAEMRAYVQTQKIDLGQYVLELQQLTNDI